MHPVCQHFHFGSVLTTTTNSDQNIIRFFSNELGVQKIKDIWISTDISQIRDDDQLFETHSLNNSNLSGTNKRLEFLTQTEGNNNNLISNDDGILQDLDYSATSFFLKVLEKFLFFSLFFFYS